MWVYFNRNIWRVVLNCENMSYVLVPDSLVLWRQFWAGESWKPGCWVVDIAWSSDMTVMDAISDFGLVGIALAIHIDPRHFRSALIFQPFVSKPWIFGIEIYVSVWGNVSLNKVWERNGEPSSQAHIIRSISYHILFYPIPLELCQLFRINRKHFMLKREIDWSTFFQ